MIPTERLREIVASWGDKKLEAIDALRELLAIREHTAAMEPVEAVAKRALRAWREAIECPCLDTVVIAAIQAERDAGAARAVATQEALTRATVVIENNRALLIEARGVIHDTVQHTAGPYVGFLQERVCAFVDKIDAALDCCASCAPDAQTWIDIVFDGPPSAESGRFVEVEDETGQSMSFGNWVQRDNDTWALRLFTRNLAELGIAPAGVAAQALDAQPYSIQEEAVGTGTVYVCGLCEEESRAGADCINHDRAKHEPAAQPEAGIKSVKVDAIHRQWTNRGEPPAGMLTTAAQPAAGSAEAELALDVEYRLGADTVRVVCAWCLAELGVVKHDDPGGPRLAQEHVKTCSKAPVAVELAALRARLADVERECGDAHSSMATAIEEELKAERDAEKARADAAEVLYKNQIEGPGGTTELRMQREAAEARVAELERALGSVIPEEGWPRCEKTCVTVRGAAYDEDPRCDCAAGYQRHLFDQARAILTPPSPPATAPAAKEEPAPCPACDGTGLRWAPVFGDELPTKERCDCGAAPPAQVQAEALGEEKKP